MRLKGILLAALIVTALTVSCGSITFKPMFDLSKWTTDTYPAFSHGSLYDAKTPGLPPLSFTGASLPAIKYKPIFDMSPGAFSFGSYPMISS